MYNIFYFVTHKIICDFSNIPSEDFTKNHSYTNKQPPHIIDISTYGLMYSMLYEKYTHLQLLDKNICNALFITNEDKDKLFYLFYISRKLYMAMSRLARIFKMKRAKKYDFTTDLCMTSFTELPTSIQIDIYDDTNRTIYTFRLTDLIQIINNALSHSPYFFPEPLKSCNPYTNVPFNKSQLYHIFFSIKKSNLLMPVLFNAFFIANFNRKQFCKNNECLIREFAISNYCRINDQKQHLIDILDMIALYNQELNDIKIHDEFPPEILYNDFKQYIPLYITSQYTYNPSLRKCSINKLCAKLTEFGKKYPKYGRKIYNRDKTYYFNHCL